MGSRHLLFLTALCSVGLLPACSGDSQPMHTEAETSLAVSVRDLETGIHPDTVTIDLRSYSPWLSREDFQAGELPSWSPNFRLVTWPDATPVVGTWVFTPRATSGQMRFVPDHPFDEAWYALQIRLDALAVRRGYTLGYVAVERDGWSTVRFHVGSFPLLGVYGGVSHPIDGRRGGGDVSASVTEPVFARSDQRMRDLFSITIDGEVQDCQPVPEFLMEGERVQQLGFDCPDPGHAGTVRVEIAPLDWASIEGVPVRLCGLDGRGSWEAPTGADLGDDCDVAIAQAIGEAP